jgi:hypothetical protein
LAEGDRDMMLKRLTVFVFHKKIEKIDTEVPACARCFAEFLLLRPQATATACVPTGGAAIGVATAVAAGSGKRPAEGPTGSTPGPKRAATWSVEDVVAWLGGLELGHVAERFRENAVDGALLAMLTEEERINKTERQTQPEKTAHRRTNRRTQQTHRILAGAHG